MIYTSRIVKFIDFSTCNWNAQNLENELSKMKSCKSSPDVSPLRIGIGWRILNDHCFNGATQSLHSDTSHQPDRWHCIQCGRRSNEPSLKHDPPYPSDRLKLVLAGSRWIIGFLLQRREQYRCVDHKQNLDRIYLQACALRWSDDQSGTEDWTNLSIRDMQLCYINISIHKNQKGFTMAFCSFSPLNSFSLFVFERSRRRKWSSFFLYNRPFSPNLQHEWAPAGCILRR